MKHVIVTGGAGFIGSHLCTRFIERGYVVTCLDNLITGQMDNLSHLRHNKNFQHIECDITCGIPTKSLMNIKYGVYGVLHFACPASPVDFNKIPFEILKADSLGTIATVDFALKYKARYILASTSEVYGNPTIHPQSESYYGNVNPIGPRSCYDETKRFAESYVSTAIRSCKLNAAIARIFNTYGPHMRANDGRLIPEFINRGIRGLDLRIYGDGNQTRSFCYISDLVEGVLNLFDSDVCEAINIGNPDERSVLDIAHIIKRILSSHSSITHLAAREDDPKKRCPNISKANRTLNWTPKVSLSEGLGLTVNYFRHLKRNKLSDNVMEFKNMKIAT